MSNAGTIGKQVEARMAEIEAMLEPLRAEYDQLKEVAAIFDGGGGATPGAAPTGRRRASRPRAARPSGGGGRTRGEQAVALIAARPGVTAAELAGAIGISRNYLYRVLPKLEQRGIVEKRGMGYHPGNC